MVFECKDKKSSAVAKVGRPTLPLISECRRPIFGWGKKVISQSDCSHIHAVVMLLYRTLQSTLGHDTVIRCWLQAATLHPKLRANKDMVTTDNQ